MTAPTLGAAAEVLDLALATARDAADAMLRAIERDPRNRDHTLVAYAHRDATEIVHHLGRTVARIAGLREQLRRAEELARYEAGRGPATP